MNFSIFPRTIYKTKSKINKEIVVRERFGKFTLHAGKIIQSGGMIEGIWKKALRGLRSLKIKKLKNILVLGLGGGTVVRLINEMLLKEQIVKAKIIGVEIDPEIIKIGKKFFGLDKVRKLKIVKADAFDWLKFHHNNIYHYSGRFDLIIVDLYVGDTFPYQARSENFMENIKKILSKNGMAVFNWLKKNGKDVNIFEKKLKKHFLTMSLVETPTNLFFLLKVKA